MNEEKLLQAQKILSEIQSRKNLLEAIDELIAKRRHIAIVDFTDKRIAVPNELRDAFFRLLRDFYKKELYILEKEFEEM